MGGIVAMMSRGSAVRPDDLARATASLGHRGPDASHHWVNVRRSVGLGATRLATIDIVGAGEPISNEDESIRAVVDGALYDFERIRDALAARGHRFRTGRDSEILVHLYEEYGTACVEHLRGEFAFVLYDARRDLVIAGRDRLGVKPLVYSQVHGILAFASEAKALFAAGLDAVWDHESVVHACALGGPLEDRTMFAGVLQVPPGHLVVVSPGHHRIVRYWDLDYPVEDGRPPRSEAEDREELAAVLDEAVRLRLQADVPIGCYLSGGLDSCTVLGLAQRHRAAPIAAFTLALDDADDGEAVRAHEMATRAGAAYTPLSAGGAAYDQDFAEALYFAERPLNNSNSVLKFQLGRAVRAAGGRVVLSGEGADEIFAGYPHFVRDLTRHHDAASRTDRGRLAASSPGRSAPPGLTLASVRAQLGGFAPGFLKAFVLTGRTLARMAHPELASQIEQRDPFARLLADLETSRQLRGRHPLHQSMYLWSKAVLPNLILSATCDRMEMAHAVQSRLPFLDHRVVELATRLPIDRLIRGGVEKYLLREVARPFVTETIYRRPKQRMFARSVAEPEAGALHDLMQTTLRGPLLRATPFFDPVRVTAVLDALPELDGPTRGALHAPLLTILSICLMQQRFRIGDVAS